MSINKLIDYANPTVFDFTGKFISGASRSGVRLHSEGFALDNVTIEVNISGASPDEWSTVSLATDTGNDAIVADGFPVAKVRISGVAAGQIAAYRNSCLGS